MNKSLPDMNINLSEMSESCFMGIWTRVTYISMGIVILFENLLLIVIIKRTPRLHTIANIFVMSLAVSDLVVGLNATLAGIVFSTVNPFQAQVRIIFSVLGTCDIGLMLCSYIHITLIAVERYVYIGHPYIHSRCVTENWVTKFLFCVWILVIIFILLPASMDDKKSDCQVSDILSHDFVYFGVIISIMLLLVTWLAYFRIATLALRQRRSITTFNISVLDSGASGHDSNSRTRLSKETWLHIIKTIRFFLVMTGSLVALTVPATVCILINRSNHKVDEVVINVATILTNMHSGINFFIILFMDSDFKLAVKKIFLCRKINQADIFI